jgi:signal transduction histidine kinase
VDVRSLLEEVAAMTRPMAEKKKIGFEVVLPDGLLPLLWADGSRVQQILLNLINNAIKFTDQGSVTVRVSPDESGQSLQFRVEDTGIGVPPDRQKDLFTPFVQAEGGTTSRRYGGTGLGLSISRHLAKLMNGTLSLHSEGRSLGSTFTLQLPVAKPEQMQLLVE